MARQKLIIIPSVRMDSNKKEDRNEHGLIRMSKATRGIMGLESVVEVYPDKKNTEDRLRGSVLLDIFQAFSSDIKRLREEGMSDEDLQRVGFVTSKTFSKIIGDSNKNKENIWITDTIEDTVIGADPEFLLFDNNGNIIRANSVLGHNGQIGSDGAMAELRPKPAIDPEELTSNILELFSNEDLTHQISQYNWKAGCYFKDNSRDYPIGGHIHIGNPIKIARMDTEKRVDFFKSFNKIIDELLSIPMIKIDGEEKGSTRRTKCATGRYGYFGEFRTCNGRLEHRTLSGMWLMHPKLSTMVFGTSKAIIDEVYKLVLQNNFSMEYMFPRKFSNVQVWSDSFELWSEIPLLNDIGCTKTSSEMISFLHTSKPSMITAKFLKEWYSKMKGLSTYNNYSSYIDELYEVLRIKPSVFEDYDKDIKKNWLEGHNFLT